MPKYLYLDANGQKQGPINDQQLKALAAQGVITPETPLATDAGHKGKAGQIPGLFATAPSPFVQTAQAIPQSVSVPAKQGSGASLIVSVIGIILILIVGGVGWSFISNQQSGQNNNAQVTSTSDTPTPMGNVPVPPIANVQAQSPPVNQTQFTAAEQLEIDRFLGEYGNDLKAVRSVGGATDVTMLHSAARYGSLAVVKYLVAQGISVHVRDSRRRTPLHWAVYNKDAEIAKFLISQGADVDAKNKDDETPLCLMVCEESQNLEVEVAKTLISHGADVNAKKQNGWTLLHNSAYKSRVYDGRNIEITKLLIIEGADVNAKRNDGGTPLEMAMLFVNVEAVRVLVANGADLNVKNKDGKTPLEQARLDVRAASVGNEAKARAILAILQGR